MIYLFCFIGCSLLVLIISMIIHIVKLNPKHEPDCTRFLKHPHKKCDGKSNMTEFILNDCASCPFWRGKC